MSLVMNPLIIWFEDWTMLMELDKPSATGNFFTVSHVGKQSDAVIESVGDEPFFANFFKKCCLRH